MIPTNRQGVRFINEYIIIFDFLTPLEIDARSGRKHLNFARKQTNSSTVKLFAPVTQKVKIGQKAVKYIPGEGDVLTKIAICYRPKFIGVNQRKPLNHDIISPVLPWRIHETQLSLLYGFFRRDDHPGD